MEIVQIKPKQNKKKNNTVVSIQTKNVPQSRQKKPKAFLKRRTAGSVTLANTLMNGIMYPDIFGPIRIPFPGDVSKTVLAMDRTHTGMQYNATYGAQLVLGSTTNGILYNGVSIQAYNGTNANSTWTTGATANPGIQFPTASQVSEARLVGCCLTLYYTGSPLNCTGEVLMGTIPSSGINNLLATHFNQMFYLPGVVKMPVADLINEPARVSGYHFSPLSWGFNATNTTVSDMEVPFFACSGLASDAVISYELTRTWEVKTSIASGYQLPFESSAEGRAVDDAIFTNVLDRISHLATSVSEGIPDVVRPALRGVSEALPSIVQSSTRAAMNYAAGAYIRALQGGNRGTNNRLILG